MNYISAPEIGAVDASYSIYFALKVNEKQDESDLVDIMKKSE